MYKIGDLVKIRTDLRKDYYGKDCLWCTEDMVSRGGKISKITRLYNDGNGSDWFYIELGHEDFIWCPEMVEPFKADRREVSDDEKQNIIDASSVFFKILEREVVYES